MTGARVRLAAAAALVALGVPVVGVGHAAACAGRAVGRWAPVRPLPGGPARQVLPLRATCALLVVAADGSLLRSADGGTYGRVVAAPVDRAFADPASGTVLAVRSGALLVSRDDGRTYAAAVTPLGPTAGTPLALAVSRADPATLLMATVAGTLTTLWRSTDGGAHIAPYATVPAAATALAYDPWQPDLVWLAATGPAGGVWRSTDGGATWAPSSVGAAADLDVVRRPGGSLVVAAVAGGVARTTDGGTTWTVTPTGAPAAVRVDGTDAVALVGGRPVRVHEASSAAYVAGLPDRCGAEGLVADAAAPRTLLLRCGDAWYALVSAAATTGAGDGMAPPDDHGGLTPGTPLRMLRRLPLPAADGSSSGSLAFDGHALYYAGDFQGSGDDAIHLMSPVDGRDRGRLPAVGTMFLTYDSRHDRLYADDGSGVWRIALRTRRRELAFPNDAFQLSFDAPTATFLGVTELDDVNSMITADPTGRIRARCSLTPAMGTRGNPLVRLPSAVVAATDGAYVVLEDDRTILRVDRACRLEGVYTVLRFSESDLENDQLTCDPLTFAPRTALWIRDSGPQTVTAYDLPGGYCPFVSTLRLRVRTGARLRACARLSSAARDEPIAGQRLTLAVGDTVVAAPPTGPDGTTCVSAPRPAPGQTAVRAWYSGTPQWTPATTAATAVLAGPPRPPRRPVVVPPAPPAVAGAALLPGVEPPPGVTNPPPHHVPGQQAQPQVQQHPAQQPGVQAGVLPETGEEPQLAVAEERNTYAMTGRDQPAALALLGAALLTAAAGAAWRYSESSAPALLRAGRGRSRDPRRRGHAVRRGR